MAQRIARLLLRMHPRVSFPVLALCVCLCGAAIVAAESPVLAGPASAAASPSPVQTDVPNGFHLRLDPVTQQSVRIHPITFLIDAGSIEADAGARYALLEHGFAMQSSMLLQNGLVITTYLNGDRAILNSQGLVNSTSIGAPPSPLVLPGHPGQLVILRVDHAILTTCDMPLGHRHYEIRVNKLYVFDNGRYWAESLEFYFAKRHIFSLGHYEGRMNSENSTLMPSYLPQYITVGSSVLDGAYLGLRYRIPLAQGDTLDINGRIGEKQIFRGTTTISHAFSLAPHGGNGNIALVLGYHEDVDNLITGTDAKTNVAYSDLTVSRLPVVDVTMSPFHLPFHLQKFTLRVGGGMGEYVEQPTDVHAFRAQTWGILDSPRYRLGPVDLYGAVGARSAFYSDSTLETYVIKAALETPLTSPVYANITYFHRQEFGATPFLFDRVIIPAEIYAEVSVPMFHSPFRLDVQNREDISGWNSRAFQVSMLYTNDCFSYGLSYNTVTKGFGFQFQFAAKGPFHRGASGIGFTQ